MGTHQLKLEYIIILQWSIFPPFVTGSPSSPRLAGGQATGSSQTTQEEQ